jgi:4-amino-4-deoxy-L-arabinose transferase-like glycosyltransferase
VAELGVETRLPPTTPEERREDQRRLPPARPDEWTWLPAALAGLTALALLLRWIASQESLFGDELTSYFVFKQPGLPDLLRDTTSPPLWKILAWFSARLGDPLTSIRWPSALAGAATVPVLYVLGREIAGRRCGLAAAALFAVVPFAVFYGSEARPYGVLMLVVAISTLALLKALETEAGLRWWVIYWVASICVLATHYTGGLALAAQASWALLARPGRRRAVLAANAAVVVPLLPWIPQLDNQTNGLSTIALLHPLNFHNVVTDPLRIAFGHPYATFNQVPGSLSIVLLCIAGLVIAVGLVRPELLQRVEFWRPAVARGAPAATWRARSPLITARAGWLLVLMTAGVLLAALIYSAFADASIWGARHVIVVLPYFCLVVGVAVAALPPRGAAIAGGLLVVGLLLGSMRMLIDYPRPDFRAAADAIVNRAPPGARVVEPLRVGRGPLAKAPPPEFQAVFSNYLDGRLPLIRPVDAGDWPLGDVYAVQGGGELPTWYLGPIAESAGVRPLKTLTFDGFLPVTVIRYSPVGQARARSRTLGAYLQQNPGALRDYLRQHPEAGQRLKHGPGAPQGAP